MREDGRWKMEDGRWKKEDVRGRSGADISVNPPRID
jgi:hypothetical protein